MFSLMFRQIRRYLGEAMMPPPDTPAFHAHAIVFLCATSMALFHAVAMLREAP